MENLESRIKSTKERYIPKKRGSEARDDLLKALRGKDELELAIAAYKRLKELTGK